MTQHGSFETKTLSPLVVGIGSALLDILVQADDHLVQMLGLEKGGMTLVSNDCLEEALAAIKSPPQIVPGGSACNTTIGIARLGGRSRFVGKAGQDTVGTGLRKGLEQDQVEPVLFTSMTPTGRVLSIITPDAQRTMLTSLGASAELQPREITPACFEGAEIVHLEGYLLFNPDLMQAALNAARTAGARISLDLASFTVVESAGPGLLQLVQEYVDILIANEDEARAFTQCTNEKQALEKLAGWAPWAVLKVGARGSYVAHAGEVVHSPAHARLQAVDTTGAGDLWAAGFLYGLARGFDLARCGRLGAACGYEVCRVIGARIPEDGWQRIRQLL